MFPGYITEFILRNTTIPVITHFHVHCAYCYHTFSEVHFLQLCVVNWFIACLLHRITNAVKDSGGLKERLFRTAYNAKRQALMNGKHIMKFI